VRRDVELEALEVALRLVRGRERERLRRLEVTPTVAPMPNAPALSRFGMPAASYPSCAYWKFTAKPSESASLTR
jgi:hypothetical protein